MALIIFGQFVESGSYLKVIVVRLLFFVIAIKDFPQFLKDSWIGGYDAQELKEPVKPTIQLSCEGKASITSNTRDVTWIFVRRRKYLN